MRLLWKIVLGFIPDYAACRFLASFYQRTLSLLAITIYMLLLSARH